MVPNIHPLVPQVIQSNVEINVIPDHVLGDTAQICT